MKKTMKAWLVVALTGAAVLSSQGAVIAAWDFTDAQNNTNTAWTTWATAAYTNVGAQNTIGDLTLENTTFSAFTAIENKAPVATLEAAPALLGATDGVYRDFGDMTSDQVMTLTGLTSNQAYRIQFLGITQQVSATLGSDRNILLTADTGATALLYTDPTTQLTAGFYAGYSEYLDFTLTGDDTDVVLTFSEVGGGKKGLSGLVVETIPEPATMGLFATAGAAMLFIRRKIRA